MPIWSPPAEGRISVERLDVTDPDSYRLPDDLRVLVNNAGVDSDYLPVEHGSLVDWRRLFETNVFGLVALTQAAIPVLRANRPAVVCNVSSSSILASVPFYSAYRATKAAVSAFGESLRVEVAPSGIRVVEILPGPIDTDMFQLSTGEAAATRFERYRSMADQAAALRREAADPLVSSPEAAAVLIADAILDDAGSDALRLRSALRRAARCLAALRRRGHVRHDRTVTARPGDEGR